MWPRSAGSVVLVLAVLVAVAVAVVVVMVVVVAMVVVVGVSMCGGFDIRNSQRCRPHSRTRWPQGRSNRLSQGKLYTWSCWPLLGKAGSFWAEGASAHPKAIALLSQAAGGRRPASVGVVQ